MLIEWKDKLVKDALENGMCHENLRALRLCKTKAEAVRLYKKTADWAIERDYPSIDFIRSEFDCEEASENGVFIDRQFDGELLNEHQAYVFHNCRGRIRVALNLEKRIIPMLYFANGCDMEIVCEQDNVRPIPVPLYIFGRNEIRTSGEGATFRRYNHETIITQRI